MYKIWNIDASKYKGYFSPQFSPRYGNTELPTRPYLANICCIYVMGWQNRLKFSGKTNQLKILLQNVYFYYFGQFRVFL